MRDREARPNTAKKTIISTDQAASQLYSIAAFFLERIADYPINWIEELLP